MTVAFTSDRDAPLYAPHEKIYPQSVKGTFRTLKWRISRLLLGIYFLTPWLRWERGPGAPTQAVLMDIDGRRAYFFMFDIWPQEVYYLAGLLIFGAVTLFLATALWGRVWCGFTCPQTVWTDLFMLAGRIIDGDRNKRMKLDKAPMSLNKAAKRILKHAVWLVISVLSGLTFLLYFNDAPTATIDILTGHGGPWVSAIVILLTVTTYVFAGMLREHFCIYMCPWLRFQGAMFDEDSLLVTYEEWRGEPRGVAKVGSSFDGRGHCINCSKCVLVCPTGIDIRNGQQVECIGCALCIDACNGVMNKFGLPPGLITYDCETTQVARAKGQLKKSRLLRPRTAAYAIILVLIAGYMSYDFISRKNLAINVQADRSPLFVSLSDGSIRNGYTFKILNMENESRNFTLSTRGIKDAALHVIGNEVDEADTVNLAVGPDKVGAFRVFIRAVRKNLSGKATAVTFLLKDKKTGEVFEHNAKVRGPGG
ncbi:MAG: cytochrome c oxidase accessory protein CcoG [Rhodospirillales bacterium RIFCSPLOWO2_12_FULL_58_28]|nr:MAG: cytochrome c oxidase accessory protein CcoG [Rhodospirillales bacterium RIFCSPLOWO2_02_FULL_58_16]OHC76793.1 MAG: cytochrome c oxidase accessory protein CcoG [Rhodospirillales bacterium RIFCSPLOWO2_12_FULL_58_28]